MSYKVFFYYYYWTLIDYYNSSQHIYRERDMNITKNICIEIGH